MFKFKRDKKKIYKEELFRFSYPSYLKKRTEGDMTVCFFSKRRLTGILRMSRIILADDSPPLLQLTQATIDQFEDEGIDNYEKIVFGDLVGIKYENYKTFNLNDAYYWRDPLISKRQKKAPSSALDWAIDMTAMMSMTMHYWEFGNDKVYFYFSYRHFSSQTAEGIKALNAELGLIDEIFQSIKMH